MQNQSKNPLHKVMIFLATISHHFLLSVAFSFVAKCDIFPIFLPLSKIVNFDSICRSNTIDWTIHKCPAELSSLVWNLDWKGSESLQLLTIILIQVWTTQFSCQANFRLHLWGPKLICFYILNDIFLWKKTAKSTTCWTLRARFKAFAGQLASKNWARQS